MICLFFKLLRSAAGLFGELLVAFHYPYQSPPVIGTNAITKHLN